MSIYLRRLRAGEQPDPDDWNQLAALVEQVAAAEGHGDVGVSLARTGLQIHDHRPHGHWARITHATAPVGNRYAHVPVAPNRDGTVPDEPNTPWRQSGTPTYLPAVEVGGRTDVPDGAKVWLEPSRRGPWFEFDGLGTADFAYVRITGPSFTVGGSLFYPATVSTPKPEGTYDEPGTVVYFFALADSRAFSGQRYGPLKYVGQYSGAPLYAGRADPIGECVEVMIDADCGLDGSVVPVLQKIRTLKQEPTCPQP